MNYLKTYLPHLFGNQEGKSYVLPDNLDWSALSFEELLMFHTLYNSLDSFTKTLDLKNLSNQQVFHLFSFKKFLSKDFLNALISHYKNEYGWFLTATNADVLTTQEAQEILNYKTYVLTLYAVFNPDRTRPGRLFVKNNHGQFVHKKDGSVWSIPVLGLSSRGLPFNHSNGTTPTGIYSIDSVMPEANNTAEFGVHRRLIVNFIKQTENEEAMLQLMPRSLHAHSWWKPCVVGREMGRSLLRIHGTGAVNKNPFSSHYPMIPSSGCLTTTEKKRLGLFKIEHQRELLDTLMTSLELPKTFENESKIHGLLYVIDFDGTYQTLEFKS